MAKAISKKSRHIVNALDTSMHNLDQMVLKMGEGAIKQLNSALEAFTQRDRGLAEQVLQSDHLLDHYEQQIDQQAMLLIALKQPMAADLREVVAAPNIATRLERIGDYAANIAKHSLVLIALPEIEITKRIQLLSEPTQYITRQVLTAYQERSSELALQVRDSDQKIDNLYHQLFKEICDHMKQHPDIIDQGSRLLLVVKILERIADHSTGVAESVYFLVTGQTLKPRSKGKGRDT